MLIEKHNADEGIVYSTNLEERWAQTGSSIALSARQDDVTLFYRLTQLSCARMSAMRFTYLNMCELAAEYRFRRDPIVRQEADKSCVMASCPDGVHRDWYPRQAIARMSTKSRRDSNLSNIST